MNGPVKFTLILVALMSLAMFVDGAIFGGRSEPACDAREGAHILGVQQACALSASERQAALVAARDAATFQRDARWNGAKHEGSFRPVGDRQNFAGETCQRIEHTIVVKDTGERRLALGTLCQRS